jgi:hypothetical protein
MYRSIAIPRFPSARGYAQKYLFSSGQRDLWTSRAAYLIPAILVRQQVDDADLGMKRQRGEDHSGRSDSQGATENEFPKRFHLPSSGKRLLCHVEEDQTHVFIRDGGPNPHMPNDRRHHARRKFVRGCMAPATIGAKTQLTLYPHSVCIVGVGHDGCDRAPCLSRRRGGGSNQ